jgi:hypothetical protein
MGVPFRHLLMAVCDIERVVDVQNDGGGRFRVTLAPDIGQRIGDTNGPKSCLAGELPFGRVL